MRRHLVRVLTVLALLAVALVLPSPAGAGPLTFKAVADATVAAANPGDNFGKDDVLLADERPEMEALVQFQVGPLDGPVSFARLRLWAVNRTWNGPKVWLSDPFGEDTVTWDSGRPTLRRLIANLGSVAEDEWVEIDVTDAVAGPGTYAFTVVPESSDGVDFASREGSSSQQPELVVETSSSSSGSSTTTGGSSTSTTTTTTSADTTTTTTGGSQPHGGPFRAVADTTVEEDDADDNHGSDFEVFADGSPVKRGLLRFQVPFDAKEDATYVLRLHVTDSSSDGPEVWTTGDFDESSVTWENAPSLGRMVADFGSVDSGDWVEVDVSSEVDGPGTYSFALVGDSSNGADFASRESGSNGPQLAIRDSGGTTTTTRASTTTTRVSTTTTTTGPTTTTSTRPPGSGRVFEVGLIGDTGYKPAQVEALDDTIEDMNRLGMTFGMHAGDIWGGNTSCRDSDYEEVKAQFNDFNEAFVYTPGDNEWEDCTTSSSSRLSFLRDEFFDSSDSLGRDPIRLTRQSGQPENARWVHNGIVFATMNEPGSTGSSGSMKDRNVDWLNDAFDEAERIGATGVLIMWQDNPFRPSGGTLYRELKDRTIDFDKPVTLVHGDTHDYEVDHPWSDADNFTRVEVFGGSDDGEWVRATIDPDSPEVFSFTRERP